MSREVDSRVVEMRFDNTNFEKNTKKTIASVDRLMEKLQFKGAEKGFEKLDEAARDVDFGPMDESLSVLERHFSTLEIVATTALVNITNKFVNAGEKLVKSLSVDQVMSGWNKYTEKTGNVQTVMNATGKSIDTVNGYLNKLMWYSDETNFSFNEMTSSLSQMTASGGDIEKMIPMVMGIANATADAGKSGLAFQSTIRNLTQSYSAGYLQLMDWKSLNLMGTATKALKQELIDTAVELGVIKKGEVTIASFESTLSKKWANTKVMEKTFEKYASMMEAAYDLVQKNPGMTSSDALEQLSGQYGELAERSALAAQQAKSFSEAVDSTKDAVSSKWMAVFETIFGNKEEATDTWTELANRLYDIFVPGIDDLRERLAEGLDSGWHQLLSNEMGDQGDAYTYALEQVALATGAVTEEQIKEAGSFGAALQENGVSADTLRQALDEARTSTEKLLALSDKELDVQGYDKDAIQKAHDKFVELNEAVQNGTLDLAAYAEAIGQVSGREHLMQGLWNIMDAIGKVVGPIKEAFHEIFPPADGERIYTIAERFDLLTEKLIITDETAEKIKKTFEGVFSVIRVGVNALKTVVKTMADIFSAAEPIGNLLFGMTASIGDFVSSIADAFNPLEALGALITGFIQTIAPVLSSFGKEADTAFSDFANGAKEAFNSFDPERMKDFITGGLSVGILASVKSFLDGIKSVGESAKGIIGGIKDAINSLGEAIDAWKEAKKSETLITIAKSVGIIAASLAVVSMIRRCGRGRRDRRHRGRPGSRTGKQGCGMLLMPCALPDRDTIRAGEEPLLRPFHDGDHLRHGGRGQRVHLLWPGDGVRAGVQPRQDRDQRRHPERAGSDQHETRRKLLQQLFRIVGQSPLAGDAAQSEPEGSEPRQLHGAGKRDCGEPHREHQRLRRPVRKLMEHPEYLSAGKGRRIFEAPAGQRPGNGELLLLLRLPEAGGRADHEPEHRIRREHAGFRAGREVQLRPREQRDGPRNGDGKARLVDL